MQKNIVLSGITYNVTFTEDNGNITITAISVPGEKISLTTCHHNVIELLKTECGKVS
jgi:hypothetical protein